MRFRPEACSNRFTKLFIIAIERRNNNCYVTRAIGWRVRKSYRFEGPVGDDINYKSSISEYTARRLVD